MTARTNYYQRHIFFCLHHRDDQVACAHHNPLAAQQHCKERLKEMELHGEGKVRVNQSGCLGRCSKGPVAVVYPEGTWYSYVDAEDIDEIVESHLQNGEIVERLLIDVDVDVGDEKFG